MGRWNRCSKNYHFHQRARPKIRQLADEPEQFRLAISLHGATDAVRNQIMPVNRKYPLSELSQACSYYLERKGK